MLIPRAVRLIQPLVLYALAALLCGGCVSRWFSSPSSVLPTDAFTPAVVMEDFGWLQWLAFACVAGGILALVASSFIPIVPRKAAATAIACGVACLLLRSFLIDWLPVLKWVAMVVLVVGGGATVWPFAVAWVNRNLLKRSDQLARSGDARAATALAVAALPHKFKTKEARKGLLSSLAPLAPAPKPTVTTSVTGGTCIVFPPPEDGPAGSCCLITPKPPSGGTGASP